ncbi:MAG: DsrE/DsrF/DrsH-like family protein [Candidatus Eisenbacteria bacterium]
MRPTARVSLMFAIPLIGLVLFASPGAARAEKSLFVNLTSNDLNRSAMAIMIAQKAMASEKVPAAIFLSVEGVRIVDIGLPQPRHLNGKTLREMLQEFMDAGGKVFACQMCMDGVGGFQKEELMKGSRWRTSRTSFPACSPKGRRS